VHRPLTRQPHECSSSYIRFHQIRLLEPPREDFARKRSKLLALPFHKRCIKSNFDVRISGSIADSVLVLAPLCLDLPPLAVLHVAAGIVSASCRETFKKRSLGASTVTRAGPWTMPGHYVIGTTEW